MNYIFVFKFIFVAFRVFYSSYQSILYIFIIFLTIIVLNSK